jgi:hypothetical protein
LFKRPDGEYRKLPITRVIVGPHPLCAVRKKTVEMILRAHGYAAEVVISEMPYIGR